MMSFDLRSSSSSSPYESVIRKGLFQCEYKIQYNSNLSKPPLLNDNVDSNYLISNLTISPDGNFALVGSNNDSFGIFDFSLFIDRSPEDIPRPFNYQTVKYGMSTVKFITNTKVIHTSTKIENDVRLIDISNNKFIYIRYYQGHNSFVDSLAVTTNESKFITASAFDQQVLLWDLNQSSAIGSLKIPSQTNETFQWPSYFTSQPTVIPFPRPVVAIDRANSIFVVAANVTPGFIKFYDMKYYSKGPFLAAQLNIRSQILDSLDLNSSQDNINTAICALNSDFIDLIFSHDGRYLLLNTNGPFFYLIDARNGKILQSILRGSRKYDPTEYVYEKYTPQVCFTPDSQFMMGGNGIYDQTIYCWNLHGELIQKLKHTESFPERENIIKYIAHCPNRVQFITGASKMIGLYRPMYLEGLRI